ncbi:hypothetical protein BH09VER1_BH09VER1_24590 [soil metagenome]
MSWIAITEADLLTAISGDELTGYREAALADSQADPVQPTIDQVTDLVRGYVGGYRQNQLGPIGTIPQKLIAPAVDIIVARIPSRVGRTPKQGRADNRDAAIKLLERVSQGLYDIEEPVVKSEEQPTSARPSFSGRDRRDIRRESSGL